MGSLVFYLIGYHPLTSFRSESVLKALLGHQIARTTICSLCGHNSRVLSPYEYRLGVALKNGRRLEDLLQNNTFAPASVFGYRCDKCKQQSKAVQHSRLTMFPDILEIDFLRFEQIQRGSYKKNCRSVPFGVDLDLSAFSDSDTSIRYRLMSVVQHLGSFGTGHYRCIAKSPGGTWEVFDDSSVSRNVRVDKAINPGGSWTPYTLFYARTDSSDLTECSIDSITNTDFADTITSSKRKHQEIFHHLTNGIDEPAQRHSIDGKPKDLAVKDY